MSNSKKITIDLSKVTHREYAHFWGADDEQATDEEKSLFFQKICGLTAGEIEELPETEWRAFRAEFQAVCLETVETQEKNSASAST
jgi:hypothetical protein